MLGSETNLAVFEYLVAPVVVLIGVGIARAVSQTYRKARQDRRDAESISEFLFDRPENPRTHTPFRQGWTTVVDERLHDHDEKLSEL